MDYYFSTDKLTVGYNGNPLIHDIDINIKKGEILTLIGPNGSGKSTILKSITKHLSMISGVVYIDKQNLSMLSNKETATKISVVLTERIQPEMMTCEDVVASGRYPYTNHFGHLTDRDREIVKESLDKVHAAALADRDFTAISDGQRQRIMLARAICQEPEIIVLDEPTSFLDIKHKIELLDILRNMSSEKNITVIMSLHEIDLAPKISDKVMCVKGDRISRFGTPDEIFKDEIINDLYDIEHGSYNMIFGSVELSKPSGEAKIFVIAGGGKGTPIYRELQKRNIAFNTGILFKNDIDYQVASALAANVFAAEAFEPISETVYITALNAVKSAVAVIDAGTVFGAMNKENSLLLNESAAIFKHNEIDKAVEYLNGK